MTGTALTTYDERWAQDAQKAAAAEPLIAGTWLSAKGGQLTIGEEVLLVIKSQDVLHSFFLPNVRMKQDVVPGMDQYMWFKVHENGPFDIVCAELCGWGHYKMKGRATFQPRKEFDEWLKVKWKEQQARTITVASAEGE